MELYNGVEKGGSKQSVSEGSCVNSWRPKIGIIVLGILSNNSLALAQDKQLDMSLPEWVYKLHSQEVIDSESDLPDLGSSYSKSGSQGEGSLGNFYYDPEKQKIRWNKSFGNNWSLRGNPVKGDIKLKYKTTF